MNDNTPTPGEMQPLWSDEMIRMAVLQKVSYPSRTAIALLTEMRNDYEVERTALAARVAELERKLSICSEYADKVTTELAAARAGRWQPVDDGKLQSVTVQSNGEILAILQHVEHGEQIWLATFLPDDIRLCRLQPGQQSRTNNVPLYTNEQIDDIVDNHIFLDNGTGTYRVWEDRANKYLREMRDKYEAELYFWQQYGATKNLELLNSHPGQQDEPAAP